jgi:pilus assembly protein CpaE
MDDQERDNPLPPGFLQTVVRLVTISLDPNSAQMLAEFVSSTPLVRLQSGLSDYVKEDQDLPVQWTQSSQFEICLIDFDRDRNRARVTAEKIRAVLPDVAIFAVSRDSQPDYIIQAMRSGCNEYLLKPLSREQLLQSIARVAGRRRESRAAAQIVAFLGAKGGAGVTMVATHLGAILAKSYSRRTLLVDLHPAFGDAELYLGILKYQYSFRDLTSNADRLDADLLQSFVLHHRSGLDLLAAPSSSPAAARTAPEAIGTTIDFLRHCYDVLLIDCPPGMSEETLEAVRRSDHVYIIAVPEIAAVRNVARQLENFARIKYPHDKIGVVINRWTKRNTITDEQIEEAIHAPILWRLPNQYYEVIRIINEGDPSSRSSSSELVQNLNRLAAHIAAKVGTAVEANKANKGLLAMLDR